MEEDEHKEEEQDDPDSSPPPTDRDCSKSPLHTSEVSPTHPVLRSETAQLLLASLDEEADYDASRSFAKLLQSICLGSFIASLTLGLLATGNVISFPLEFTWMCCAASLFLAGVYSWVLYISDVRTMNHLKYESYSHIAFLASICSLCVLGHTSESSQTFLRVGAIFIPPVVHSKYAQSGMIWTAGVVAHFCVVIFHFRDVLLREGWQWLAVLFVVDALLIDNTQARLDVMDLNAKLSSAYSNMADMAKIKLKNLYIDICDADVSLDAEGIICEPAPRLATLLSMSGRGLVDRSFASLVCTEDCAKFREYIQEATASGEPGTCETRPRTLRVNLTSTYGTPVCVVLFNAYWERLDKDDVIVLGICEAWQPGKERRKKPKSQAEQSKGTQPKMESGSLMPLGHPDYSSIRQDFSSIRSRKRADSPRPDGPKPPGQIDSEATARRQVRSG